MPIGGIRCELLPIRATGIALAMSIEPTVTGHTKRYGHEQYLTLDQPEASGWSAWRRATPRPLTGTPPRNARYWASGPAHRISRGEGACSVRRIASCGSTDRDPPWNADHGRR